jgi:outer membrane protein OmpA-like peptidoglycan-associated protein
MTIKLKAVRLMMTAGLFVSLNVSTCVGQDRLPRDNSEDFGEYHRPPAYRESESHPLRILAYIVHPIGWVARELIFRPFSYFASSTPETRMVMGYREPHDIYRPSCFGGPDDVPDCRQVKPFDYDREGTDSAALSKNVVFFPDMNFDFNKRTLNKAGKRKAEMVAKMLLDGQPVDVELQGHADARGATSYNEKLGMDRADTVKKELVSLGVASEHLYTVSFGERKPLFEENEEWAHAANRRVEVQLTGSSK